MRFEAIMALAVVSLPNFVACDSHGMTRVERDLIAEYQNMVAAYPDDRHYSLAANFKERLLSVLSQGESFSYPFDSLRKHVTIIESADKRLRIFSWDEISGGSCHDLAAIAQFKGSDGAVRTQLPDSEDSESGPENNVSYEEIHDIQIGGRTHYLTIAWGSCGAGHHFKVVQSFRILEETVERDSLFEVEGKVMSVLLILAARIYDIRVIYDKEARTITYDEFSVDPEMVFSGPTGRKVKVLLENGVFEVKEYEGSKHLREPVTRLRER